MTRALKLLAALSMLVALAGVVVIAGWTQLNAYLVRPGPAKQETVVVLERGAGLAEIASQLRAARVIEQPWLFRLAVRVLDRDRELKAGEYAFPAGVTPGTVIGMVSAGQTVARRLTIAEGLTVAEVFRLLDETDALSGELPEPPPALCDTRAGLVRRMRRSMDEVLEGLWAERARHLPLSSPEEALILASIVDKETSVPEERRKVAAVFVNRLRRGMRLQSDPTVIYGLTNGERRLGRELTRTDWEHVSDFNTYLIAGLPPAPIANPGRESIAAVLDPADVDYLYFVADGSGGHAFARTLAEHNRNVAAWRRIRDGEEPKPVEPPSPKSEPAG
jgi:UPF0755 protein